jgi:serine/threonine protein kinase
MASQGEDHSSVIDALLRAIAHAPAAPIQGITEADPSRVANFRILGRLGSGGMGIVYRAQDESLRREVALKVLPPVHARDAERRQRFLREARSAAALIHRNVAIVYQVGEDRGRDYLAMELVEGLTLRALLETGPLAPDVARDLALQVAEGLAAAHDKRIVHRDLKPENVMVTAEGVVKLLDFGLAKSGPVEPTGELEEADTEAQITRDGLVLGSSAYMSPEQTLGLPVDPRSDVFSLGILFYEMLAGRRPFLGKTHAEIRAAIVSKAPAPLAGASKGIDRVVMRCLEKRPEHRYDSAAAIVRELRRETTRTEERSRSTSPPRPAPPLQRSTVRPSAPAPPPAAVTPSEVKGLWFVVARQYVLERYGPDVPLRMAERVAPELRPAILEPMRSSWYPEACLQQSLWAFDDVVTRGDQKQLITVYEECTLQGIHRFFRAALRLASPDFLLRKAPVMWSLVRRNQGSVSVETDEERALVRYVDFPYFDDFHYRLLARATLRQLGALGHGVEPTAREVGFGKDWLTVEVRYR